LLDDADWIARTYGLLKGPHSALRDDVAIVKRALLDALANSHLDHPGQIADERKEAALDFLQPYHNVFSTNYDLLLYWVNMHAENAPPYQDGFRADPDDRDTEYVVFSERLGGAKGLFFIHGALHLYVAGGELRKHCWVRTGRRLTDLVREGLGQNKYP